MVITTDGEIKFITAYGPKLSPGLACPPGRTKQAHREECDINVIMKRYEKTGVMPDFGGREGRYIDCSGADFRTSMETVAKAKSIFAELPAALRARFLNDPSQMLDFVNDEANRDEALEMGLLKPQSEWAKPEGGEVAPPPATTAPAAS